MSAETVVTIVGPELSPGDHLRALKGWLSGVEELRGRVQLRSQQPQPGTLGMLPEALVVAGPLVAALVPALISWIRSRHTSVTVELTGPDGRSVKITADQVRRLGAAELTRMLDETARSFGAAGSVAVTTPPAGAALEPGSAAEPGN
jgi:hypothetical protein